MPEQQLTFVLVAAFLQWLSQVGAETSFWRLAGHTVESFEQSLVLDLALNDLILKHFIMLLQALDLIADAFNVHENLLLILR